jgi:hypothetical protein
VVRGSTTVEGKREREKDVRESEREQLTWVVELAPETSRHREKGRER